MADNSELVFSTNPDLNKKCPRCKKLLTSCTCKIDAVPIGGSVIIASIRLEKKGRGGKTVTVVECLPANEEYLKNLAQTLKKRCGSGGTFKINEKGGVIELQGDKQSTIKSELEKLKIKCK